MKYKYTMIDNKYRFIQVGLLIICTGLDFVNFWNFLAGVISKNWSTMGYSLLFGLAIFGVKILSTFCVKKLQYIYCDGNITIKKIYTYYEIECLNCDIKQIENIRHYANLHKNYPKQQTKCKYNKYYCDNIFFRIRNRKNLGNHCVKAFANGCSQNLYVIELLDGNCLIVGLDEFMYSLLTANKEL